MTRCASPSSSVRARTIGTFGFLGYGSSLESDREFSWSRLERVNDGFFVKLAYQVRRYGGTAARR